MVYYSVACTIPDPDTDTVIVTGGAGGTYTTVSVYSVQGWKDKRISRVLTPGDTPMPAPAT